MGCAIEAIGRPAVRMPPEHLDNLFLAEPGLPGRLDRISTRRYVERILQQSVLKRHRLWLRRVLVREHLERTPVILKLDHHVRLVPAGKYPPILVDDFHARHLRRIDHFR
jgi:hypothetical protein